MNAISGEDSCGSDDNSDEDSFEELKEIESRFYSVIHYNNLSETAPSDLPEGFKIEINESDNVIVTLSGDYDMSNIISTDNHVRSSQLQTCLNSKSDESLPFDDERIDLIYKETNENLSVKCVEKNSVDLSSSQLNCKETDVCDKEDDDVIIIGDFPVTDSVIRSDFGKSQSRHWKKLNSKMDSNDKRSSVSNNSIPIPDPSFSSEGDALLKSAMQSPVLIDNNELITNINSVAEEENQKEDIFISSDDAASPEKQRISPVKNKVSRKKRKKFDIEKYCPRKWTTSMVKYYCKTSNKKMNFDSSKLINKMKVSVGSKGWFLNEKDVTGRLLKRPKKRCLRCRQFDHEVRQCTEPIKPITCYMCGEIGHRENRCPYRKCLTCGKPNPVYVPMCSACVQYAWKGNDFCSICNSNHHEEKLCPDIWRSFLFTSKEGPLVIPLSEKNTRKICCNCGKSSHFDYECREMNNTMHVSTIPNTRNYFAVAEMLAEDRENFKINIRMNSEEGRVISSDDGYQFLQNLSNSIEARLELDNDILTVQGSRTQCEAVFDQLSSFVSKRLRFNSSFHKHKKKKTPSKTRRTI